MTIVRWIQFILGACCILGGLSFCIIQMVGVFRFKYVLNRMHAGALGDTLGVGLILVGLMFFNGLSFATLKLVLVFIILWISSPVASHMVGKLEVLSRRSPEECCPVRELPSLYEIEAKTTFEHRIESDKSSEEENEL